MSTNFPNTWSKWYELHRTDEKYASIQDENKKLAALAADWNASEGKKLADANQQRTSRSITSLAGTSAQASSSARIDRTLKNVPMFVDTRTAILNKIKNGTALNVDDPVKCKNAILGSANGTILGKGNNGEVINYNLLMDGKTYDVVLKIDDNLLDIISDKTCLPTNSYRLFNPSKGYVKIDNPIGAFICSNIGYNETMLAALSSELARSDPLTDVGSINFLDTYGFLSCDNSTLNSAIVANYFFMERIHKTLREIGRSIKYDSLISILFQSIHAFGVMQSKYKMMHNDGHTGNIFLQNVNDSVDSKGEQINKYNYMQYIVDDVEYNIPVSDSDYIVKLGDWGYGNAFDAYGRTIMSEYVAIKRADDFILNEYNQAHDIVLLLFDTITLMVDNKKIDYLFKPEFNNLKNYVFSNSIFNNIGDVRSVLFKQPRLDLSLFGVRDVFKNITPKSVFESGVFDRYKTKQSPGKCLLVGRF